MQQIYDQIQQRLEEKQLQEEMKEQERQQIRENQERMNLEDLKVWTQGGDTAHAETMQTNQNIYKKFKVWLLGFRRLRKRGQNNSSCRKRSCVSMLRPCWQSCKEEKRRSWLTWEIWNTSRRKWSDESKLPSHTQPPHFISSLKNCFVFFFAY